MGVAYWDEYAPILEEPAQGYDWVETGERWPDSGRPKKRRVPRSGEVTRRLDPSGQWARMPRVMLAKCAEAQALRRAFPECLSALYEAAEMDQAQTSPLTPTEQLGQYETGERLERSGAADGVIFQLEPHGALQSIPLGQLADKILETVQNYSRPEQLQWFQQANTLPLREFWARIPAEALEVKKALEQQAQRLESDQGRAIGPGADAAPAGA
jgi:hypothetical protein